MLVITTILFTFVKLTVSVNYWDIRWGQGAGRNTTYEMRVEKTGIGRAGCI